MFVLHGHKKENKMNDQMEQVWRSKDGKCVGSKEKVEAYLATLSPLAKMWFPYFTNNGGVFSSGGLYPSEWPKEEREAFVAFANLAKLYPAVIEAWDHDGNDWRTYEWTAPLYVETVRLLLAYEEALKLVPR